MILLHYKKICDKIRLNLIESWCVFIALNAWFSSQRVAYLKVLIYWVNVKFQFHEHLIENIYVSWYWVYQSSIDDEANENSEELRY